MKKLLYVGMTELMDGSDGVTKKILQQLEAFAHNGYSVFIVSYDRDSIVFCEHANGKIKVLKSKDCNIKLRRLAFFSFVNEIVADNFFDVCYIRYPCATRAFINMLKHIRGSAARVVLEIPTYPIPRPKLKDLRSIIQSLLFIGGKANLLEIRKYVDTICSMGEPTEEIFGVKNVSIPNGISVDSFPVRVPTGSKNEIHILFCGSFYFNQGVDRLVSGMGEYYRDKSEGEPEVYAELVGNGPELSAWLDLAKRLSVQDKVTFHGFLSGKELDTVANKCDIACSSLAIHRAHMMNASPLKTKEYMARGLPFMYAYNETGLDESVPFALHVESSEEPIDIRKVIAFAQTVNAAPEEISMQMRRYAQEHYSWEKILEWV